jgi:hypothetical protein
MNNVETLMLEFKGIPNLRLFSFEYEENEKFVLNPTKDCKFTRTRLFLSIIKKLKNIFKLVIFVGHVVTIKMTNLIRKYGILIDGITIGCYTFNYEKGIISHPFEKNISFISFIENKNGVKVFTLAKPFDYGAWTFEKLTFNKHGVCKELL